MFCSARNLKISRLILPVFLVGIWSVSLPTQGEERTLLEFKRGETANAALVPIAQGPTAQRSPAQRPIVQELASNKAASAGPTRPRPALRIPVTLNSPPTEVNSPGKSPLKTTPPKTISRRGMAPPKRSQIASPRTRANKNTKQPNSSSPGLTTGLLQSDSFTTAGAGLAIVLGLFFACAWMMRKSGPKPTSPLPRDAVAVLGRVPLAARNFAHLLQVGNKLVLVSVTADGVTPITEVTDPIEVQRLLGMCQANNTSQSSTSVEFHNVLEKLAKEPASGFLGNEATAAYGAQKR